MTYGGVVIIGMLGVLGLLLAGNILAVDRALKEGSFVSGIYSTRIDPSRITRKD